MKATMENYYSGTDKIIFNGSSADIVNCYAGLDEDNIKSADKV